MHPISPVRCWRLTVDFKEIAELIPHRPPFLWVDRVLELQSDQIRAEKEIPADLELFQGHYPDYPIMPGVLLCEAVFQAGALLIASDLKAVENDSGAKTVPVLTRINNAKFKREVKPGDRIEMLVRLTEKIGPAWFLHGTLRVNGKVAVKVDFACTLIEDRS